MQFLITIAVTAVAVFQTSSFGGNVKRSEALLVRSVIDGDTIDVATVGRVRLLGIMRLKSGAGSTRPRRSAARRASVSPRSCFTAGCDWSMRVSRETRTIAVWRT